eukprot:3939086-Rhodomonas_salina.3
MPKTAPANVETRRLLASRPSMIPDNSFSIGRCAGTMPLLRQEEHRRSRLSIKGSYVTVITLDVRLFYVTVITLDAQFYNLKSWHNRRTGHYNCT